MIRALVGGVGGKYLDAVHLALRVLLRPIYALLLRNTFL